jgi:ANTAR domain
VSSTARILRSSLSDQFSPAEFAGLFADIGRELSSQVDNAAVLEAITGMAVRAVPGADHAGITVGRANSKFVTVAATSELVNIVDQIQYDLHSGPCLDAVTRYTTFLAPDLRIERRWPDFGPRAVEMAGIVSMLSLGLYSESDGGLIAGLNMYSHSADAFDDSSQAIATLLATHGALAVGQADARAKAASLMQALKNSREIGIAIGVLMAQQHVTRAQAFDLLRIVSQHTHRKLADIATEVADTGAMPDVPKTRPAAG